MPAGDGTGPAGLGPMTGRAAGYCAGYPVPGYMNPIPGRGGFGFGRGWFGRGWGRGWFGRGGGRGRRNWYYATGLPGWSRFGMGMPAWGGQIPYWGAYPQMGPYPYGPELTPEQEKEMLQSEADLLKQQMEDIQERIRALEEAAAKSKKE